LQIPAPRRGTYLADGRHVRGAFPVPLVCSPSQPTLSYAAGTVIDVLVPATPQRHSVRLARLLRTSRLPPGPPRHIYILLELARYAAEADTSKRVMYKQAARPAVGRNRRAARQTRCRLLCGRRTGEGV
jgi:hypothetical protein